MSLDDLFCEVDDFCRVFLPTWPRQRLTHGDSIQTIAGLTTSPNRRWLLQQKVAEIAEAAERTIESPHDRVRFENWLGRVRKALEAGPVLSGIARKTPSFRAGMNSVPGKARSLWRSLLLNILTQHINRRSATRSREVAG